MIQFPGQPDGVFIHHDARCSPLQPPYDGPFRILETGPKSFVVDMGEVWSGFP